MKCSMKAIPSLALLFLAAAALMLTASTVEARTNPDARPHESWISLSGKVKVGDVVRVTGSMDTDFFEGRELVADAIVTVSR